MVNHPLIYSVVCGLSVVMLGMSALLLLSQIVRLSLKNELGMLILFATVLFGIGLMLADSKLHAPKNHHHSIHKTHKRSR